MSNETFISKFREFEKSAQDLFNPETASGFLEFARRDGSTVSLTIEDLKTKFAAARVGLLRPYERDDELLLEETRSMLEDFKKYERLATSWSELVKEVGSGTQVSSTLKELEPVSS